MKFKDYVKTLNEILATNPESAEYDVIYSIDEEGNDFKNIYYTPTVGYYDSGGFISVEQFEEYEDEGYDCIINSVCVN